MLSVTAVRHWWMPAWSAGGWRKQGEHVSREAYHGGGDGQNISTTVQNGSLTVRLLITFAWQMTAVFLSAEPGWKKRADHQGWSVSDCERYWCCGRVISGVKDGVNDQDAVNVSNWTVKSVRQRQQRPGHWRLIRWWGCCCLLPDGWSPSRTETRVSTISKDDKGNYSYKIDVRGFQWSTPTARGTRLSILVAFLHTDRRRCDRETDNDAGWPARVRISSEHPLVLTNVAAGMCHRYPRMRLTGASWHLQPDCCRW